MSERKTCSVFALMCGRSVSAANVRAWSVVLLLLVGSVWNGRAALLHKICMAVLFFSFLLAIVVAILAQSNRHRIWERSFCPT